MFLFAQAAVAALLEVHIDGIVDDRGQLIVAVCGAQDEWLDIARAARVRRVAARAGAVEVAFADLPPGQWAVFVVHDANNNGALDMRYFPIPGPTEAAGVSNNVRPTLGPPRYRDAVFDVRDDGAKIHIALM